MIKDGIKTVTANDLQRFTNALCYMWQRAPRSVSYAPAAYYADLLAERGRMYLYDVMNPEEPGEYNPQQPGTWKGGVHANLTNTMFFM